LLPGLRCPLLALLAICCCLGERNTHRNRGGIRAPVAAVTRRSNVDPWGCYGARRQPCAGRAYSVLALCHRVGTRFDRWLSHIAYGLCSLILFLCLYRSLLALLAISCGLRKSNPCINRAGCWRPI
jgi:hypothetical protein